jgi:hypothetical protein
VLTHIEEVMQAEGIAEYSAAEDIGPKRDEVKGSEKTT